MTELEERNAVVAEARSWLRTPYRHMGRVKGRGVDCAMLLIEVYSRVGKIQSFDPGYYPNDWMLHRSEERYLGWVEKYAKQVDAPERGDVVLFKVGRCFAHGAIVLDWPVCIHARGHSIVELVDFVAEQAFARRERCFYTLWPKS